MDQTDRAIIDALFQAGGGCPCDIAVMDDATGDLTAQALEQADVRVMSWSSSYRVTRDLCDRFVEEIAQGRLTVPAMETDGDAQGSHRFQPVPLEDALREFTRPDEVDVHFVLGRLPRALAALDARSRAVARALMDHACLILGSRVKHMTPSQNTVLEAAFDEVRGARGVSKSRALIAEGPRPATEPAPVAEHSVNVTVRGTEREIPLRGIGGVFGSARADAGSLLLLEALDRALSTDPSAVLSNPAMVCDLGCGNGLLSAYLAAAFPDAQLVASDDDADAVASTRATLAAQGEAPSAPQIQVTWDDALSTRESATVDLLLLNPPFHDGAAVDPTLVQDLLDAAARVLRPGGELWFVHNSHLRYRPEVERRIGPVRQQDRDRRFTVLSATRR